MGLVRVIIAMAIMLSYPVFLIVKFEMKHPGTLAEIYLK